MGSTRGERIAAAGGISVDATAEGFPEEKKLPGQQEEVAPAPAPAPQPELGSAPRATTHQPHQQNNGTAASRPSGPGSTHQREKSSSQ